jgi:hypothetical protein
VKHFIVEVYDTDQGCHVCCFDTGDDCGAPDIATEFDCGGDTALRIVEVLPHVQ